MAVRRTNLSSVLFAIAIQLLLFYTQCQRSNNIKNHQLTDSLPIPLGKFQMLSWKLFKPSFAINHDTRKLIRSARKFNCRHGYLTGLLLLCGDIASHPGPVISRSPTAIINSVECLLLNARSLKSFNRDVVAISKTRNTGTTEHRNTEHRNTGTASFRNTEHRNTKNS